MPKALNEQVVVITGASSGIGHCAARAFSARGARLVVGARRNDRLNALVHDITQTGGQAIAVPMDVTQREQVDELARTAVERFGRIDTWINNAGVSVYALFDKLDVEEIRRVMEVNFMGTVQGIRAALPILKNQGEGTIINLGSLAGKRGFPLQTAYTASKFAITSLGEALRAELHRQWPGIKICTVSPPPINTPFFDNACSREGYAARPLPPVYPTERVVDALLGCALRPRREVNIGITKPFVLWNRVAGGLLDRALGRWAIKRQLTDEPKSADAPSNLFTPSPYTREHGDWTRWARRRPAARIEH